METEITLYTKPGCPWCSRATLWLDEHGYTYRELDVIASDEAFAEMKKISSQSLAPTMKVGDLVLADFGPDELEAFLKEHDLKPNA